MFIGMRRNGGGSRARRRCDDRSVAAHRRDPGLSLVEILVSITLLGIGVSAVLVGLRTTTAASAIDREHATVLAWLHAASDEVYRAPYSSCEDHSAAAAAADYQLAARDPGIVPTGWSDIAIEVTSVEFLWRSSFDDPYGWSPTGCMVGGTYEAVGAEQFSQRVTIQVTAPRGGVHTVEMVKGGS